MRLGRIALIPIAIPVVLSCNQNDSTPLESSPPDYPSEQAATPNKSDNSHNSDSENSATGDQDTTSKPTLHVENDEIKFKSHSLSLEELFKAITVKSSESSCSAGHNVPAYLDGVQHDSSFELSIQLGGENDVNADGRIDDSEKFDYDPAGGYSGFLFGAFLANKESSEAPATICKKYLESKALPSGLQNIPLAAASLINQTPGLSSQLNASGRCVDHKALFCAASCQNCLSPTEKVTTIFGAWQDLSCKTPEETLPPIMETCSYPPVTKNPASSSSYKVPNDHPWLDNSMAEIQGSEIVARRGNYSLTSIISARDGSGTYSFKGATEGSHAFGAYGYESDQLITWAATENSYVYHEIGLRPVIQPEKPYVCSIFVKENMTYGTPYSCADIRGMGLPAIHSNIREAGFKSVMSIAADTLPEETDPNGVTPKFSRFQLNVPSNDQHHKVIMVCTSDQTAEIYDSSSCKPPVIGCLSIYPDHYGSSSGE